MTALIERGGTAARIRIPTRFLPVLVTFGLFVLMFAAGGLRYESFASGQVLLNLFIDGSFLIWPWG